MEVKRREALTRIALILGGSLTAPSLLAMNHAENQGGKLAGLALDLTEHHRKIIAAVAEHILPKTDTPGAIDAGVPAFVEKMIQDCYRLPEQMSFLKGLKDLEKSGFLKQSSEGQVAMLTLMESNTKDLMRSFKSAQIKVGDNVDKETLEGNNGVPFWRLMKELTLLGYFSSEVGIKASFIYEPIPGKFEPIKIKAGQKAYQY